jgi:hypothetical protein
MTHSLEIYAPFMGEDATISVEFDVTDWGAHATFDPRYGGDPGWGAEFDVTDISITLNMENGDGVTWPLERGSRQFNAVANCARVENAISEKIADLEPPRRTRRGRRYTLDDAA